MCKTIAIVLCSLLAALLLLAGCGSSPQGNVPVSLGASGQADSAVADGFVDVEYGLPITRQTTMEQVRAAYRGVYELQTEDFSGQPLLLYASAEEPMRIGALDSYLDPAGQSLADFFYDENGLVLVAAFDRAHSGQLSLYGLTFDATRQDIMDKLGEPYHSTADEDEDAAIFTYQSDEGDYLTFLFYDGGLLQEMVVEFADGKAAGRAEQFVVSDVAFGVTIAPGSTREQLRSAYADTHMLEEAGGDFPHDLFLPSGTGDTQGYLQVFYNGDGLVESVGFDAAYSGQIHVGGVYPGMSAQQITDLLGKPTDATDEALLYFYKETQTVFVLNDDNVLSSIKIYFDSTL